MKALSVPLGLRNSGCLFHETWRSRRGCPLGSKLGGCSLSSRLRVASNTGTGSAEREEDRGGGGHAGLRDAQAEAMGPGGSLYGGPGMGGQSTRDPWSHAEGLGKQHGFSAL